MINHQTGKTTELLWRGYEFKNGYSERDFDRASLTPLGRRQLDLLADALKEVGDRRIELAGHCDERGTNEYNLALGDRRSNSAADYVTSLGIPINRMRTVSFGEERPVCTVSSPSCWDRNRRAHFVITSK